MPAKLRNDGQRVQIVFTCHRLRNVTRTEQSSVGHHPGIPSPFLMCGTVVGDKTTSQFAITPKKASVLPTIERVVTSTVFFQKRRHTIHVHPLGYNPCNEICIFRYGRDDLYIHLITHMPLLFTNLEAARCSLRREPSRTAERFLHR